MPGKHTYRILPYQNMTQQDVRAEGIGLSDVFEAVNQHTYRGVTFQCVAGCPMCRVYKEKLVDNVAPFRVRKAFLLNVAWIGDGRLTQATGFADNIITLTIKRSLAEDLVTLHDQCDWHWVDGQGPFFDVTLTEVPGINDYLVEECTKTHSLPMLAGWDEKLPDLSQVVPIKTLDEIVDIAGLRRLFDDYGEEVGVEVDEDVGVEKHTDTSTSGMCAALDRLTSALEHLTERVDALHK